MSLELILDKQFSTGETYKLPQQLQANRLVLQVESAYLYQEPGTLTQDFYFPEIGIINGSTYFLKEGIQLIKIAADIPYELTISARVPFHLYLWLFSMPLSNPSTVEVNFPSSSAATASTVASVASPTSAATLLAPNSNRKGATIWNNSTARLFIDHGDSVASADFTARLEPGGYYEAPFGYTGQIVGIWESVNGNAQVREFT